MTSISPGQLAALFDAHAASLKLYARQWLGAPAAEDVVQEAFLALMGQSPPPPNVRAWLFRTVRNQAISAVRSGVRRTQREREFAAVRGDFFEFRPGDVVDAHAAQQALESLPAEQREIVVLRLWGGMTLAEIAGLTGSPISSVYDQYRAALAKVRKLLELSCKMKTD